MRLHDFSHSIADVSGDTTLAAQVKQKNWTHVHKLLGLRARPFTGWNTPASIASKNWAGHRAINCFTPAGFVRAMSEYGRPLASA